MQWYMSGGMVALLRDSKQVARFAQGVLMHSSTSTSQLPLKGTLHGSSYSGM